MGIALGIFAYISLLCSIKSFGVSFTSPYAPVTAPKGNKFLLEPIWKREYRAPYVSPKKIKEQDKFAMKWKFNPLFKK